MEANCTGSEGDGILHVGQQQRDFGRPALVFTVGRSGSSLVTHILKEHGCWIGNSRPGDEHNPLGYFENLELKRRMKAHHGWNLTGPFPTTTIGWRAIVRTILNCQGYVSGPWAFKTGVHYAGIWAEFSPIVIKVIRHRDEIIRSYQRYGGIHRALSQEDFLSVIDRGLERLKTMPGIEVDTDDLVTGRRDQIRTAVQAMALPYDEKTTDSIVNVRFWHAG